MIHYEPYPGEPPEQDEPGGRAWPVYLYVAVIALANLIMIWKVNHRPPLPTNRGPVLPADRPADVP